MRYRTGTPSVQNQTQHSLPYLSLLERVVYLWRDSLSSHLLASQEHTRKKTKECSAAQVEHAPRTTAPPHPIESNRIEAQHRSRRLFKELRSLLLPATMNKESHPNSPQSELTSIPSNMPERQGGSHFQHHEPPPAQALVRVPARETTLHGL